MSDPSLDQQIDSFNKFLNRELAEREKERYRKRKKRKKGEMPIDIRHGSNR